MAEIVQTPVTFQTLQDRVGSYGLRAIGGVFVTLGVVNVIDEIRDWRVAPNAEICVSAPDSQACNDHVAAEHQDSLAGGIGSIVGSGLLAGLLLYVDRSIRADALKPDANAPQV